MSKSLFKQFQYEIQTYQEECVNNIIHIFESLQQGISFVKVFQEHYKNTNYHFPIQDTKNIDVLMETGTGKTFTFIKTIFELNRNFGYKKFIVLVPSVAIREGTKTTLEDTREYFKTLYANEREKEIETLIYESGNISTVKQFISSAHLSVLLLTPSSFSHKDNILNRPLEYEINQPELFKTNLEPPQTYLECLKRLNPIVIMDEPHRFDGNAFKKYFTGFENYYLRFGATFPKKKESVPLSNVAYVLDSISSFRKSLVKKIVVYTQEIVQNADTLLAIENQKAIVNTLINGVVVRRELQVGSTFNGKAINKINKDSLVLFDGTIEKLDYSLSDDSLRAMIRQTIQIHFQKEKELFERGIKALTLFFIPNDTSLYRGENPKIKNIFEEEYVTQRKEVLSKLDINSEYYKYLQNDFDSEGKLQVHKGYFSGDKGNSDEKIKAGVEEILKDKKKLLSLESPTRFIFSIWALQEGWDNPNVFTLCKLSNQGSEISKLQQIGRGLRICVNQNLQRQTLKNLNYDHETFWKINNLDVVVSNKEQDFVESIQKEILNNSFLISETFTEQELKKLLKEKGNLDDVTTHKLFKTLEESQMILFQSTLDGINLFTKSAQFSQILREQNLPPKHIQLLENLFINDTKTYIQKAEDKQEKKKIYIKATHFQEFQNLWSAIYKNAVYTIEDLNEEQENQLIQNIKTEIEELRIEEILLQTKRAELNINQINTQDAITQTLVDTVSYKSKVDYLELVKSLSNTTKTPLSFVVKIFNALSPHFRNKMLCNNPERAQKEISQIINKHLIAVLKTHITYNTIEGNILPNLFPSKSESTKPN